MSIAFSKFQYHAHLPQNTDNQIVVAGLENLPPEKRRSSEITIEEYRQIQENHAQTIVAFENAISALNESENPEGELYQLIETIAECSLFQCSNKIQALLYLEPLVRDQVALKNAARTHFLPSRGLNAEEQQDALWLGVYYGEIGIVKEAISRGARIDNPLYSNMYPIVLASARRHENIVRLLIEMQADVRRVCGTHGHKTALSEARIHQSFSADLMNQLERLDGGFTNEVLIRKIIAHLFSGMSMNGKSSIDSVLFPLWGFRIYHTLGDYLKNGISFYKQEKWLDEVIAKVGPNLSDFERLELEKPETQQLISSFAQQIEDAFAHAWSWDQRKSQITSSSERRAIFLKESFERLDNGLPVICFGLTYVIESVTSESLHAWGMTAIKESDGLYSVQLCNRSSTLPGIIPQKMTQDALMELWGNFQDATDWKRDFRGKNGSRFYSETAKLFYPSREERIVETQQKIGNCCHYSLQSLELGVWIELLGRIFPKKEAILIGKATKELRTGFTRAHHISGYLESPSSSSSSSSSSQSAPSTIDESLLTSVYYRSMQHPKLTKIFEAFVGKSEHYEKMMRDESLAAAWPKIQSALCRLRARRKGENLPFPDLPKHAEEVRPFLMNPAHQDLFAEIKSIDLSGTRLRVFPEELRVFASLTELNLRNCELKSLPPLSFPQMVKLDLSQNLIQEVTSLDFPQLKELTLENNQLKIPPQLMGLPNLQRLNLSKNELSHPPAEYPKSLEELSLVSNRLRFLNLPFMPALQTLRLTNNPLKEIPPLPTPELKNLYLDNTFLEAVSEEQIAMLNGLAKLEWLNASHNHLSAPFTLNQPGLNLNLYGNPF